MLSPLGLALISGGVMAEVCFADWSSDGWVIVVVRILQKKNKCTFFCNYTKMNFLQSTEIQEHLF
jgi:hypothetical protein